MDEIKFTVFDEELFVDDLVGDCLVKLTTLDNHEANHNSPIKIEI